MVVFHLSETVLSLIRNKYEQSLQAPASYNCFSKFNQNNMKYNRGEFLLLLTELRNSPKHQLVLNDLFPNNTDANYNKSSPVDT